MLGRLTHNIASSGTWPAEFESPVSSGLFTSDAFTSVLRAHHVQISMDGKGRWIDNVFIERLWRTIKYEEVYLKAYQSLREAKQSIENYLELYNPSRIHQHLDYQTPDEVYFGRPVQNLAA